MSKNSLNYEILVIFGGDGTINEVVNGISSYFSSRNFKILVVPIGSGNDFVKNYFSKIVLNNIESIFDKISNNDYRLIKTDLGKIVINQFNNVKIEKYFINAAGFGFDAFVAYYKEKLKFLSGLPAYFVSLVFVLLNYSSFKVIFKFSSNLIEQESLLITVANGISSGGGFYLTPDANIQDNKLDVGLIRYLNIFNIFIKLPYVLFNKTKTLTKDIKFFGIKDIDLSFDKSVFCHIDGEITEEKIIAATIRVLPNVLEIIIIEN